MRASIAVVLGLVLGACFNPNFDNPMCGPQGECPSDHTCVQGICRAMPDQVDATIDSAIDSPVDALTGDGDVDGPPIDAPDLPCQPATCMGQQLTCGNCIDDDADGLTDAQDPECLGACDDTEDRLNFGYVGEGSGNCLIDCYYDRDSGQGNDGCRWDRQCWDTQGADPSCPFDPLRVGSNQCPFNQNAVCQSACFDLRPNGCDSLGCCEFPGFGGIFVGSHDAAGTPTCTLQNLADPNACWRCQQQPNDTNLCESCEVCVGRPLPGSCSQQDCPAGRQLCGQPGQASCLPGEWCVTGCCQQTLP